MCTLGEPFCKFELLKIWLVILLVNMQILENQDPTRNGRRKNDYFFKCMEEDSVEKFSSSSVPTSLKILQIPRPFSRENPLHYVREDPLPFSGEYPF